MLSKFTLNSTDGLRQEETGKHIIEKIGMLTVIDLSYFDEILALTAGTHKFTVLEVVQELTY